MSVVVSTRCSVYGEPAQSDDHDRCERSVKLAGEAAGGALLTPEVAVEEARELGFSADQLRRVCEMAISNTRGPLPGGLPFREPSQDPKSRWCVDPPSPFVNDCMWRTTTGRVA